jgi:hypothetical protein
MSPSAITGREQVQQNPLFDHLVGGGEQCRWDVEAERLGGPEIDDKLEFGGPHDRQISRLLALENLTPIQSFSGLFRALRAGVALPAAALVPMASALREQRADRGE